MIFYLDIKFEVFDILLNSIFFYIINKTEQVKHMLKYINIFIIINFIFISFILFFIKSKNKKANILLAIFLLIIAYLDFLSIVIENHYEIYKYLIYTPYIFSYASWPFFYFYFLMILNKKIKLNYKTILHFIIVIYLLIRYTGYLFLPEEQKEILFRSEFYKTGLEFQILSLFLNFIIIPFYIILSLIACIKERNIKKNYYSTIDKIKFDWVFQFLIILTTITIFSISLILSDLKSLKYFYSYIPLFTSIIFFYLVYKSLKSSNIFIDYIEFKDSYYALKKDNKKPYLTRELNNIQDKAYEIKEYIEKNKSYLKQELNITNLAKELEIPAYILSYIINKAFKKNFFDFINSYRIEEVKKRLIAPEYKNIKIESIGYDSGFNSRTSFYEMFKKYTGLTPSEYKANYT